MSLTKEQKQEAKHHAEALRAAQAFARAIRGSPSATVYEREMAGKLFHHAYKGETEAALLGGEE